LAYTKASSAKILPLIDVLYSQKLIDARVFSFKLSKDPDSPGSVFTMGSDARSVTPFNTQSNSNTSTDMHYFNVVATHRVGLWLLKINGLVINSQLLSGICNVDDGGKPCVVLVDSGSSFIGLPGDVYDTVAPTLIENRTDCDTNDIITCVFSTTDNLPSFGIQLNDINGIQRNYILDPTDYMYTNVIAIQRIPIESASVNMIILGDAFLRNYVSLFDMDNAQVGFLGGVQHPVSGRIQPKHARAISVHDSLPKWVYVVTVACALLVVIGLGV
jgi:hypothetical protein